MGLEVDKDKTGRVGQTFSCVRVAELDSIAVFLFKNRDTFLAKPALEKGLRVVQGRR